MRTRCASSRMRRATLPWGAYAMSDSWHYATSDSWVLCEGNPWTPYNRRPLSGTWKHVRQGQTRLAPMSNSWAKRGNMAKSSPNVLQRSQRTAFRHDFTEMYSWTAHFGEIGVFCTLRTEKTLSEGTFREYLAKNVEVFCPRVQNTPILPLFGPGPSRKRRRACCPQRSG